MELTEIFRHLSQIQVFARLSCRELLIIASCARMQNYAPNSVLIPKGEVPTRLFLPITGSLRSSTGNEIALSTQLSNLLFNLECAEGLESGDSPKQCLVISRSHFHTIIKECPQVIVDSLQEVGHTDIGGVN